MPCTTHHAHVRKHQRVLPCAAMYGHHPALAMHKSHFCNLPLQPPRLACAPFGGPIAAIRDERRMVVITGGGMRPVIRTFTAAGEQLGAMVWERGTIVEWGWSDDLELIIMEVSGRVRP